VIRDGHSWAARLPGLTPCGTGLTAFGGAFRVFPDQRTGDLAGRDEWNTFDLWKAAFGDLAKNLEVFAEDAFGTQFARTDAGVLVFLPETGQIDLFQGTLTEFAQAILSDPNGTIFLDLYEPACAALGTPRLDQHLAFKVELSLGGVADLDNLQVMDAVSHMRGLGMIARQISTWPIGTRISSVVLETAEQGEAPEGARQRGVARDALRCIQELVLLQGRLCCLLGASYQFDEMLFTVPRTGSLELDGECWEFRKHGGGVAFTRPRDGVAVDAHKHLDRPEAFDAWRLDRFCEAAGVDVLTYRGLDWRTDDQSLGGLIDTLVRDGVLEPIAAARAHFRLVFDPERKRRLQFQRRQRVTLERVVAIAARIGESPPALLDEEPTAPGVHGEAAALTDEARTTAWRYGDLESLLDDLALARTDGEGAVFQLDLPGGPTGLFVGRPTAAFLRACLEERIAVSLSGVSVEPIGGSGQYEMYLPVGAPRPLRGLGPFT
jgi:hypothetical protein